MAEIEPVLDIAVLEQRMTLPPSGGAVEIRDDFYRYYRDTGLIIAPLANDTLPIGATITARRNYFVTVAPLDGNRFAVSRGTPGKKIRVSYDVTGPDGADLGKGVITLLPMAGQPGLGGFSLRSYWQTIGEDEGPLSIDLADLLAPHGSDLAEITAVRALSDGALPTVLEGTTAHVDLTPLAGLDAGETARLLVEVAAEADGDIAKTLIPIRVTGSADPEMTVTTATGGVLQGGSGNDRIISRPNQPDDMVGGPGDDIFIIPDFADGRADHDRITDFLPGRDTLRFDGAEVQIAEIEAVPGGLRLTSAHGDTLELLGDGVTASALIGANADLSRPVTEVSGTATSLGGDWDLVNTITILNVNYPKGVFQGFGFGVN